MQLDLPTTSSSIPTNVIVGYMSNPVNGLEAVYICVPVGSTEAGKIKEWLFTKCIWRNGQNETDLISTQDFPPAVPNLPAGIRLRPETIVKE